VPMNKRESLTSKKDLKDEEIMCEKKIKEYEGTTASMPLCVFNLMNAILGSGILGLANTVANLGVVLFTVMLIGVSGLAFNSICLLLELCDFTGCSSYETLGRHAFGMFGKFLTAINIFVHTMGAMCSFLFIVKFELPEVVEVILGPDHCGMWYTNGDCLVILITLVVIVPLAAAKNIGFLGYTSGFAMCCMILFTGVVVAEKFVIPCPIRDYASVSLEESEHIITTTASEIMSNLTGQHHNTTEEHHCSEKEGSIYEDLKKGLNEQTCDVKSFTWNSNSAYAIPTMVFAFQCHASVLPIYTELSKPTVARMKKVAMISIGNVFVLYFLAAIFGYLTFYSATGAELLLMYSAYNSGSFIILISRLMVLTCVIFSTPLLHYPARKALDQMLFEGKPFSWFRHLGIMVVLLTTVDLLVVFVPDIRLVFGLAGATCASMLVIILPSLFYIRIIPGSYKNPKKIVALSLALIGTMFMVFSVALIILKIVQKSNEKSLDVASTASPQLSTLF